MDQLPASNNSSELRRPEQLIAAVLHLMSHYSISNVLNQDRSVCVKLAAVIERHLKILAELPGLTPVLRATCAQLAEQWLSVIEQTMPTAEKTGLLARLRPVSTLN